ncbi:MAG: hypothetical protein H0W58_16595 [Acidobacteria bacterium]|jgi:hypothetical protein|nr:hypothetical protein [Acidobacteriota bacterium]
MEKSNIVVVIFALLITGAVVLAQKSATVADFFAATKNVTIAGSKPTDVSSQSDSLQNNAAIKQSAAEVESNVLNSQTPDYIFYDMLFNMVKSFDSAAARREANGGSGRITNITIAA